jgi:ribosomal-protein-alanine N-acetyltransferase
MTPADVLSVAALDAIAFPSTAAPHSRVASADLRVREELSRPWSHSWVIRSDKDDAVDAYLIAWLVTDEVHLLSLATDPSRRRRGLARTLVHTLLEFARSKGARTVLLEVRRSNRAALALYRAAGFYIIRLRTRYYPDDEDAVEMALALDPATGHVVPKADEALLDA